MASDKVFNPVELVKNLPNWFNNIICDPTDPLNAAKNNIKLTRPALKPGQRKVERYVTVFRNRSAPPGEAIIGPFPIQYVMMEPNHESEYPHLKPDGNHLERPNVLTGDDFDPLKIRQGFTFTSQPYHEDVEDKKDKFNRSTVFQEFIAKRKLYARWICACLLTDQSLNYSRRNLWYKPMMADFTLAQRIDDMMPTIPPLYYSKRDIPEGTAKPKGDQYNQYDEIPGTESFMLGGQPFALETPGDNKDLKHKKSKGRDGDEEEEKESFKEPLPEWVQKTIKRGYYYAPFIMETLARRPNGEKVAVEMNRRADRVEAAQEGNIFCARVYLTVVVKDYNWSALEKLRAAWYICPPPRPLPEWSRPLIKLDDDVLDAAEAAGFVFPLLGDNHQLSLVAPDVPLMLKSEAAHPDHVYEAGPLDDILNHHQEADDPKSYKKTKLSAPDSDEEEED